MVSDISTSTPPAVNIVLKPAVCANRTSLFILMIIGLVCHVLTFCIEDVVVRWNCSASALVQVEILFSYQLDNSKWTAVLCDNLALS